MEGVTENRAERDVKSTGGNTETPAKKQPIQKLYWCFTLNNYDSSDIERLERTFKTFCEWYCFQPEIGSENGVPHLQGVLKLLHRKRLTEIKELLDSKAHWEPTRSVKASIAYCTKMNTKVGDKIYTMNVKIPKRIKVCEPYGWQLQVMDIIKDEPSERGIHWFWEPEGNFGKSSLCKYLAVHHKAIILCGKSTDMFHGLAKMVEEEKEIELIIIDVPRVSKKFINIGAIESIKNGLIFSGKYEGAQLIFNPPHVIVFANEPPDESQMSKDRWSIVKLRDAVDESIDDSDELVNCVLERDQRATRTARLL